MTITRKQMRAAGLELRRRREGQSPLPDRPFGDASEDTLRRFASGPTPDEVSDMKTELAGRDAGDARRRTNRGPDDDRPFAQAQTNTLREHVKAHENR